MHKEIVEFLNAQVPGCEATLVEAEVGDSTIFIQPSHIKAASLALRDSEKFQMNVLQVITGCDYEDRIEVSYILASFIFNTELILKVKLPKTDKDATVQIDSIVEVWTAADFQERECYDMIGVVFDGHPDFRRILCPEDWKGYPLRKDYVVEEVYNGMVVNPENKMNHEDHYFYKKIQEEQEDPKKVTFSWKD